jgi:hypothetical protein
LRSRGLGPALVIDLSAPGIRDVIVALDLGSRSVYLAACRYPSRCDDRYHKKTGCGA